jgi:hypothetical protein
MVLLWEVVETLGGGAWLEEVGHHMPLRLDLIPQSLSPSVLPVYQEVESLFLYKLPPP